MRLNHFYVDIRSPWLVITGKKEIYEPYGHPLDKRDNRVLFQGNELKIYRIAKVTVDGKFIEVAIIPYDKENWEEEGKYLVTKEDTIAYPIVVPNKLANVGKQLPLHFIGDQKRLRSWRLSIGVNCEYKSIDDQKYFPCRIKKMHGKSGMRYLKIKYTYVDEKENIKILNQKVPVSDIIAFQIYNKASEFDYGDKSPRSLVLGINKDMKSLNDKNSAPTSFRFKNIDRMSLVFEFIFEFSKSSLKTLIIQKGLDPISMKRKTVWWNGDKDGNRYGHLLRSGDYRIMETVSTDYFKYHEDDEEEKEKTENLWKIYKK